jgi:hypothetical protein
MTRDLPEDDTNVVRFAVAHQWDASGRGGQETPIHFYCRDATRHPVRILDPDLIARRVISEGDLEAAPRAGNARVEVENRTA